MAHVKRLLARLAQQADAIVSKTMISRFESEVGHYGRLAESGRMRRVASAKGVSPTGSNPVPSSKVYATSRPHLVAVIFGVCGLNPDLGGWPNGKALGLNPGEA